MDIIYVWLLCHRYLNYRNETLFAQVKFIAKATSHKPKTIWQEENERCLYRKLKSFLLLLFLFGYFSIIIYNVVIFVENPITIQLIILLFDLLFEFVVSEESFANHYMNGAELDAKYGTLSIYHPFSIWTSKEKQRFKSKTKHKAQKKSDKNIKSKQEILKTEHRSSAWSFSPFQPPISHFP